MLKQALLAAGHVVKRNRLVQDAKITCLAQVTANSEYQPHRVVIEPAAYAVIAAFGQRLVLVVATAVGKLGRCDIYDTFAGTLRNLMYKTYQVLI